MFNIVFATTLQPLATIVIIIIIITIIHYYLDSRLIVDIPNR